MIGDYLHGHTGSDEIRDRSNPIVFDRCVTIVPPTPGKVEALRLLLSESHAQACHRLHSNFVQSDLTSCSECVNLDLTP